MTAPAGKDAVRKIQPGTWLKTLAEGVAQY